MFDVISFIAVFVVVVWLYHRTHTGRNTLKTTVDLSCFRQAFHDMDRDNNFSYEGLEALFDSLEEDEESTGEESELDVIALCCEYTEYEDIEEYNKDYEPVESIDEIAELTTVIPVGENGFIIQAY